jgi:hypothetical protein
MRAVAFVVSCLFVLGFYGYVLTRLYREHKRFKAQEKRLPEHLYEMEPETATAVAAPKTAAQRTSPNGRRKETLLHVGVAIGGLLGVFAEIEFLNQLVSFH